jgi:hypothetical protein
MAHEEVETMTFEEVFGETVEAWEKRVALCDHERTKTVELPKDDIRGAIAEVVCADCELPIELVGGPNDGGQVEIRGVP